MTHHTPWAYKKALEKIQIVAETGREWLVLERLGLTHLPAEIFTLTHLTELIVIDNVLTTIPAQIAKLHNLTRLDLFHNKLEELPDEIEQLKKLQHLNLSNNNLMNLPLTIKKMDSLAHLDLRGNPLSIPTNILELVNRPNTIIQAYMSNASTVPVKIHS